MSYKQPTTANRIVQRSNADLHEMAPMSCPSIPLKPTFAKWPKLAAAMAGNAAEVVEIGAGEHEKRREEPKG